MGVKIPDFYLWRLIPSKFILYRKSPFAGAVTPAFVLSLQSRIFFIESSGAFFLSRFIKVHVIVLTIFQRNAFASISKTKTSLSSGKFFWVKK